VSETESNSNRSDRYHIPSLRRALRVVEYLSENPQGATLTEIVEDLQLPKNSVFRITTTLMDEGYLARSDDTMRFQLTRKFLAYGLTAVCEEDVIVNSMDVMKRLRDTTDTTAYLGALYGAEGVIIEQAPGGHPFKLSVDLGTRFSLHSGAPGKAMLAFLPEEQREDLMSQMEFIKFNDRTITDPDEFRLEMERIRECGYALDHAEEFEGIHCVGAPILDHNGSVVATLWISGAEVVLPKKKFKEYGPIVRDHAMEISRRLGYGIRDSSVNDKDETIREEVTTVSGN